MFRYLKLQVQPAKVIPVAGAFTVEQLSQDATIPITLHQINGLPENAKKRIYRGLLPPHLLAQYEIDPISWNGKEGGQYVRLKAEEDSGKVSLGVTLQPGSIDEFICIEMGDNAFNGIDLNLLLLNAPDSPTFRTDIDSEGRLTQFGTVRRNLAEEERAMDAGLAPGQVRRSLGASQVVFQQIEAFLMTLGHRAYFLEPLTYASAWVFERRGFAYVRGHKLMDDIHREFQPGGILYQALDGSTPFRQKEQWNTVRGRAWAIQDGILEVMGTRWDKLRMVKQIGRHAGVETFPGSVF
jgi:hypothetical protein